MGARSRRIVMYALVVAGLLGASPARAQCEGGIAVQQGCDGYTWFGCCDGERLYWCDQIWLCVCDCSHVPLCGWDHAAGYYNCDTYGNPAPGNNPPMECPNEPEDEDGDGYDTDSDCNDHDPNVHPGAQEDCSNGIDDDCDGYVDDSDDDCAGDDDDDDDATEDDDDDDDDATPDDDDGTGDDDDDDDTGDDDTGDDDTGDDDTGDDDTGPGDDDTGSLLEGSGVCVCRVDGRGWGGAFVVALLALLIGGARLSASAGRSRRR